MEVHAHVFDWPMQRLARWCHISWQKFSRVKGFAGRACTFLARALTEVTLKWTLRSCCRNGLSFCGCFDIFSVTIGINGVCCESSWPPRMSRLPTFQNHLFSSLFYKEYSFGVEYSFEWFTLHVNLPASFLTENYAVEPTVFNLSILV